MVRVKRGKIAHKRRKHLLKYVKGFRWGRKAKYRAAKEALIHAWKYAYRDRKAKKDFEIPKPIYIWQAVGCKECNNEGYTGRIGLFEILSMTDQLTDIILKEPSEREISKEAERQGMITMKQDGILKVLTGVTTIEEVLRVAEEK